jgi:cell division protein FtsI (penicillin-binding protein 3)
MPAGGRGADGRAGSRPAGPAGRRRGLRGRSSPESVNGRIRLLRVFCLVFFALAFGRALALAAGSSDLMAMAAQQQVRSVDLPAHRGTIVDRTGEELAVGQPAQTVFATPYLLKEPQLAAQQLAEALGIKKPAEVDSLAKRLADSKSGFAFVERKAAPAAAAKALKLGLGGVGAYAEEERVYPLRSVATQLLGMAGVDNNGLAGLELEYDRQLAGKAGSEVVVRDPAGRSLRTLKSVEPDPGQDLRLTIDADIQYTAEQVLAATVKDYHAKGGTAVVMNPTTGEIYAMANAPIVTAARFGTAGAKARNRAVVDAYEPGSIFKVVTVAGALQDGLVKPTTKFLLPPTITVGGRDINEAHLRATITYTVDDILTYSSNVGAIKIGARLKKSGMMKWMKAFGVGQKTGIDFPGETAGIMPDWSAATMGNLPMGQGVAVSPIEMASIYATIANGGVRVEPHLVSQIGSHAIEPPRGKRVVSTKVAAEVMTMLTHVVAKGTGMEAKIAGYVSAGKTGTAEKPLADGTGYSKTKYVASFVDIVPAAHPQLLVLVMVDEPQPIWGGVVAAPAARDIASYALQHLEIAP